MYWPRRQGQALAKSHQDLNKIKNVIKNHTKFYSFQWNRCDLCICLQQWSKSAQIPRQSQLWDRSPWYRASLLGRKALIPTFYWVKWCKMVNKAKQMGENSEKLQECLWLTSASPVTQVAVSLKAASLQLLKCRKKEMRIRGISINSFGVNQVGYRKRSFVGIECANTWLYSECQK